MSQHRNLCILVLIILALVTACTAVPTAQATLPAEPLATVVPTTVQPTQAPPPPDATTESTSAPVPLPPTATSEPVVVLDGKDISVNGISFFLPSEVAADSSGTLYDAPAVTADSPFWEKMPDHYLFLFQDYRQNKSMHQPRIYIWPIADYIAENPSFQPTVTLLKNLLADRYLVDLPAVELPFPPIFNAGKVVSLRPEFLDFQNGSGVRYLTFFAQATTPITNYGLFYTYQGITADEKYYVSAILPIGQTELPADDSGFQIDDAFYNHYQTYLSQVQMQVAEAPDHSFLPRLSSLDTMLRSLLVNPAISPQTVFSQYADFYKGSILLNSKLGLAWEANNSEATNGDGSEMPMSIHPYMGGLNLTGYPLQEQFHKPRIITFDLADYLAMDPRPQATVDNLKAILGAEGQPLAIVGKAPFFPMFPANQMFYAQAKILHFQNGSGLRYLSMYSQAFLPVDSYNLFYTFQGISADGKTFIIAILPIKATSLPDQADMPADMDAFIANIETYLAEVTSGLNALTPEQFTPNLSDIDELMQSIRLW